jgi:hypothetical protein
VAEGRPDIAARLCDGLEVVATRDRLSVLSARAYLAGVEGGLEEAARLHAEAAAGWRAYGHVPEEGFSLLAQGRCLLELGRDAEGRAALDAARAVFAGLGAEPYLGEVDALLGRVSA